MAVDGKFIEQLQNALLNAFRGDELARMVRIELDESLESISNAQNQTQVVFDLIEWADRQGRLGDLITAAKEHNPDNPALKAVELKDIGQKDIGRSETRTAAPQPTQPVLDTADERKQLDSQNLSGPSKKNLTWVYGVILLALLVAVGSWISSSLGGDSGLPKESTNTVTHSSATEGETLPNEEEGGSAEKESEDNASTGPLDESLPDDRDDCVENSVYHQFEDHWSREMGCPKDAAQSGIWSTLQPFEGGYLLWRSDIDNPLGGTGSTYVFYGLQEGLWKKLSDFHDGTDYDRNREEPTASSEATPLSTPEGGFGFIWEENDELYEGLKYAIDEQKGFCALIQDFDHGFILRTTVDECSNEKGETTTGDVRGVYWHPLTIVASSNDMHTIIPANPE